MNAHATDSCTDLPPMTFELVPAIGNFVDGIFDDSHKFVGTKPGKRFHMRARRGDHVVSTSVPLSEKNARKYGEKYCARKNARAGI